ncbi:MAG: DNA gyrase subunit B [Chlorobi bacterium OLB7]|nr:MAG: DNA gyrase subunit B [Chlorobi bacterium OLB7]
MRELAFLNPTVTITMTDEREDGISEVFHYKDGLVGFVKYIDSTRTAMIKPVMISGEKENTPVEICFQYNSGYSENVFSYVNDINTHEGGTHVSGFRSALTRTLNAYAQKNKLLKNEKLTLTGEDFREGLTAVISVKVAEPQFEGQTKTKLGNSEVDGIVRSIFGDVLTQYLEENPKVGKAIIDKVFSAAEAREAARKSRELVRRKNAMESMTLPGKLADCSIEDPEHCEIFLVEGDSAGGCFSGDTKIALADGRNLNFFELLAEQEAGKENFCYTIRHNGTVGLERIINVRMTKANAEVIRVTLDNGKQIVCTPDHRFMLRDGSYKAAAELKTSDSLMPLHRKLSDMKQPGITINGYEMVWNPKSEYNNTLAALKEIEVTCNTLDLAAYRNHRIATRNKSLLSFETFCQRYFNGDTSKAVEAVQNYNHRIVKIERLDQGMDVYDLEVPTTHNFALADGVFVHNSAKSARDRRTQAILPLRGKVLNVQKARINKVLENEEIRAIFTALGVGFGETLDISKARYGKVILMADADVDGAHIRTLLLTLFFNYMREMIEEGKIYLAMPPLYKVKKGKGEYYAYDEAERDEILKRLRKDTSAAATAAPTEEGEEPEYEEVGRTRDGIVISRFKGLGEMNPEQLWATTMNPDTRTLQLVTIENAQHAAHIFETLMGDSVEPRRQFIERNARYVRNLDV